MARIRTVKPEFWTDAKVVALSIPTRLFFIGCWNQADDYGVLEDCPDTLRLRIMPGDPDFDVRGSIDELVESGRMNRAVAPDGTAVLVIVSWFEHQKIDNRSTPRWFDPRTEPLPSAESHPIPPSPPKSPQVPPLEGKGREGTSAHGAVFAALDEVFGAVSTSSRRSHRGKVAKELVTAGASPEEVVRRGKFMLTKGWRDATESALSKHWDSLAPPRPRETSEGIPLE